MTQVAKQVNRREALQVDATAATAAEHEQLANAPLEQHHTVSDSRRRPINLFSFVTERNEGQLDPAKKVVSTLHMLL